LLKSISNWHNSWLSFTNHKNIATLYFIFGSLSVMVGTVLSVIIRLELAQPDNKLLPADYQLHSVLIIYVCGTVTILFFIIVMLLLTAGFINWLLPVVCGIHKLHYAVVGLAILLITTMRIAVCQLIVRFRNLLDLIYVILAHFILCYFQWLFLLCLLFRHWWIHHSPIVLYLLIS
jgi:heme/copper-type cytochrome/quinol oxidase subunit 1